MIGLTPRFCADASGAGAKHRGDLIIKSSKFPAAQPPDPNLPSKIETEYWPCPPSLATMGTTDTPQTPLQWSCHQTWRKYVLVLDLDAFLCLVDLALFN